jgi:hypothetical protein
MATVTYALVPTTTLITNKVKWTPLANGDSGSAVDLNDYRDRSVQVLGTFGTGGSVTLQGSNDGGTTWATLTDQGGNNLTFTAAGIKHVQQLTEYIRPTVTAGDGTTALTVYVFFRGREQ